MISITPCRTYASSGGMDEMDLLDDLEKGMSKITNADGKVSEVAKTSGVGMHGQPGTIYAEQPDPEQVAVISTGTTAVVIPAAILIPAIRKRKRK